MSLCLIKFPIILQQRDLSIAFPFRLLSIIWKFPEDGDPVCVDVVNLSILIIVATTSSLFRDKWLNIENISTIRLSELLGLLKSFEKKSHS